MWIFWYRMINIPTTKRASVAVIVIIVLLIVFAVFPREKVDLFCPDGCNSWKGNLCGDKKSKFYTPGNLDRKKDDINSSLDKIIFLSEIETRTVKWRRCLLLGSLITLIIFAMIEKLPSWKEATMGVFLSMIVLYASFSYYWYHYYSHSVQSIKDHVKHIRDFRDMEKKVTV
jgi:hypothetical protein